MAESPPTAAGNPTGAAPPAPPETPGRSPSEDAHSPASQSAQPRPPGAPADPANAPPGASADPMAEPRSPAAPPDVNPDPLADATSELLLRQFYSSLRVSYLAAQPAPGPDANAESMRARIQDLLKGTQSWRGAYEIEQLLAFVMTDDQVAAELPRRLAEAKSLKLDYVEDLDRQFKAAREGAQPTNDHPAQRQQPQVAMRYILHRLINDLQWFYDQRIRRREAATRLLRRINFLFLIALIYFFLLLFSQVFFMNSTAPRPNQATSAAARASPANETGAY